MRSGHEREPIGTLLPVVSDEVIGDIFKGLINNPDMQSEILSEMQASNGALAEAVLEIGAQFCFDDQGEVDSKRVTCFALTAAVVYGALRAQAETDSIREL